MACPHPRRRALALSLALAGLGGCREPVRPVEVVATGPNVVVLSIDGLRADHTSLHGYERSTTPNLDRIAADGAWMARYRVCAPRAKPSVASLMTGLYPSAHGARIGSIPAAMATTDGESAAPVETLDRRHTTFVEVLQDGGYATHAFVADRDLAADAGFDQGFDEFVLAGPVTDDDVLEIDAAAMAFVESRLGESQASTLVWAHVSSVLRYASPRQGRSFTTDRARPVEMQGRGAAAFARFGTIDEAIVQYDEAVKYVDGLVGALYDRVRSEHPDTVFVVTSSHGEEHFEHGGYGHGQSLFKEMLHVPLVVAGPGVPAGAKLEALCDGIDLYPTLLGLAGVDGSDVERDGVALFADGELVGGKSETFAEKHHEGPFVRFALERPEAKLIEVYRYRPEEEIARRTGARLKFEFFETPDGVESLETIRKPVGALVESHAAGIRYWRERNEAFFLDAVGRRDAVLWSAGTD